MKLIKRKRKKKNETLSWLLFRKEIGVWRKKKNGVRYLSSGFRKFAPSVKFHEWHTVFVLEGEFSRGA